MAADADDVVIQGDGIEIRLRRPYSNQARRLVGRFLEDLMGDVPRVHAQVTHVDTLPVPTRPKRVVSPETRAKIAESVRRHRAEQAAAISK